MSRNNCVDKKKKGREKNKGAAVSLSSNRLGYPTCYLPKKKQCDHKLTLKYVNSWKLTQLRKPMKNKSTDDVLVY